MNNHIKTYLTSLHQKYTSGVVHKQNYRPLLKILFRGLDPSLNIISGLISPRPGVLDLFLVSGRYPLGCIEEVDIGTHLSEVTCDHRLDQTPLLKNLIPSKHILSEFRNKDLLVMGESFHLWMNPHLILFIRGFTTHSLMEKPVL